MRTKQNTNATGEAKQADANEVVTNPTSTQEVQKFLDILGVRRQPYACPNWHSVFETLEKNPDMATEP